MTRLAALLVLLALPSLGRADGVHVHRRGGNFGFGLGGGTLVSGLSFKQFLGDGLSVQVAVGYLYGNWHDGLGGPKGNYSGLGGNLDLLAEMPRLLSGEAGTLNWYFGAGLSAGIGNWVILAASPILGLAFRFGPLPIDLALELRPTFQVAPGFSFLAHGSGAALRWWF